jgi:hypothetical protein
MCLISILLDDKWLLISSLISDWEEVFEGNCSRKLQDVSICKLLTNIACITVSLIAWVDNNIINGVNLV